MAASAPVGSSAPDRAAQLDRAMWMRVSWALHQIMSASSAVALVDEMKGLESHVGWGSHPHSAAKGWEGALRPGLVIQAHVQG